MITIFDHEYVLKKEEYVQKCVIASKNSNFYLKNSQHCFDEKKTK
jgi:hypothetical protein